jgi:starch synthase
VKILFAAAEVAPYAKVGGLGDVAASLPKALAALGHDVRVITPDHGGREQRRRSVERVRFALPAFGRDETATLVERPGPAPVYLVGNRRFFGGAQVYGRADDLYRYHFFAMAVLRAPQVLGWTPDVLHCNDWHTATLPYGLRNLAWREPAYRSAASVLTIHNLAYRGPDELSDVLAQGIYYADAVSTVSPTYAREIATPEQGQGLDALLRLRGDRLHGILNGLDYGVYDPAADPALAANFSASALDKREANKRALLARLGLPYAAGRPLAALVSRFDYQKGIDLVAEVLGRAVTRLNMQFAVLGSGDPGLYERLAQAAAGHPTAAMVVNGYDPQLASLIYAGADCFLMPSRFEPCGLGQLIAMRYGAAPVVRRTGGLADTVIDVTASPATGTGFVFDAYEPDALFGALERSATAFRDRTGWRALQRRGMGRDSSWASSAQQYVAMYQQALESKG